MLGDDGSLNKPLVQSTRTTSYNFFQDYFIDGNALQRRFFNQFQCLERLGGNRRDAED